MKRFDKYAIVASDGLTEKNLYDGYDYKKESDVSYRMRLLARLINQVRKECGNNNLSLTDITELKMFNQIVEATRKVDDMGAGKPVTNKSTHQQQ